MKPLPPKGRGGRGGSATADTKKRDLIRYVSQGKTLKEAREFIGVTADLYKYYRKTDSDFATQIDIALGREVEDNRKAVPDFPEFCEEYLGKRLFYHQLQWFDLLEGREPRDLHPSMTYEPGNPNLLIVNTPPYHAKSTTITMDYVTWRIVRDPGTRIVIVSKSQRAAMKFLLTIKTYLTHPNYKKLQDDFGPAGGYQKGSASWKQNLIYLSDDVRDAAEKDPTVEAIGIGGQLYGARANLIILDDCVDNGNANEFEKQIGWIQSEVRSRISKEGKLLIVGTRLAPKDLYVELQNPDRYPNYRESRKSPWTYLAQPAVLEYADDPKDWKTLWPYSNKPTEVTDEPHENGMFPVWDGPNLEERRGEVSESIWARVYMQQQVTDDTVFKPEAIAACTAGWSPGPIPDDPRLGRVGGMTGLKVIAGVDPAMAGFTAMVAVGLDMKTGHRYVINVHNQAKMTPDEIRAKMREWTLAYGIAEWRVEDNAFQSFLTQDREIRTFLAGVGSILTPHTTGRNKHDVDFGVAAMALLFETGQITLPRPQTESVKALTAQLSVWEPSLPKTVKTDCVMALWFAMLRINELAPQSTQQFMYRPSEFLSPADYDNRYVLGQDGQTKSVGSNRKSVWWLEDVGQESEFVFH